MTSMCARPDHTRRPASQTSEAAEPLAGVKRCHSRCMPAIGACGAFIEHLPARAGDELAMKITAMMASRMAQTKS
jgi:hypothetical protein